VQTVTGAERLRARVRSWRDEGLTVGLVPTMGSLHAGHLALVRLARSRCDRVVTSIFVNPTQFGPDEDFARYPRRLAADQALLAEHGCDLVFAPEQAVMYPFGVDHAVRIHVPVITEVLEGARRPGHFDGVATVVTRLFHLVAPDVAVFGRKDYQQLCVIERLVQDLSLPITILGAPTEREPDGLALSSRNQYLSAAERQRAPQLHATLRMIDALYRQGHARGAIEQAASARLGRAGFEVDYAVIRRADDLAEPNAADGDALIALIAARLGQTRLIDNLSLIAAIDPAGPPRGQI
jgi:pantoate--beta-alanine ligase